jgi:hypothetical protein
MDTGGMGMGYSVPKGVTLRQVPGFNGKYVAGSDGHIYCYSDARVNAKKPKPFRLTEAVDAQTGYPSVAIIVNGRKRTKSVHLLVCMAFHGEKPSTVHEVRHLDGTRTNSKPKNLRWGTQAENEADKRRHGTAARGSRHGIAKMNEEAVRILKIAIPAGLWNPIDAAKVFGVDPSVIRSISSGKSWKHVK